MVGKRRKRSNFTHQKRARVDSDVQESDNEESEYEIDFIVAHRIKKKDEQIEFLV